MKKIYLLTLFLLTGLSTLLAQQEAQYSQYMFNSLVINPAYAGYKETLNANLLYRDQWTGIKGAPKTQSVTVDAAIADNKVGLGLAIIHDKTGLQSQSSAYANYAYRLPVGSDDARLAFGVAIGVGQYVLNGSDAIIDDPSDPDFNGGKETYFTPDAKFGVFYSNEKFYAGISTTNLFAKAINYQQVGNGTISRQNRHYFLTGGALINVNDFLRFKPSFLIREDLKGPTNIDINNFFLIKDILWLGASYRTSSNLGKKLASSGTFKQNALVGVVEVYLFNNMLLGYSFDYALSSLTHYSGGTHEISLGIDLNFKSRSAVLSNPRYF